MHLQLTGDLPHCVLGWRTYEQHGLEPELIAIYGPVASQEEAARLVQTLLDAFPAQEENYTVMPVFRVQMDPEGSDPAVAA